MNQDTLQTAMLGKQRNQIFQYLKAIAIVMVIDDHMSTRIGILSSIFPYNSFYMAMLVFISGYFYKKRGVAVNIGKKVKGLLIPYLGWAIAGIVVAYILKNLGIVNWHRSVRDSSFLWNLLAIEPPPIVGAMWFAIMLLWVSILYNLIRAIPIWRSEHRSDYALLALSILVGMLSLKLCMAGYCSNRWYLPFLRAAFYFPFFHMGVMFRRYWEKYIQNVRTLYLCGICVLINVILLCEYGESVNFYSTSGMASFQSFWLPFVTSVTGTLFWYKLAQFVSTRVGSVGVIDFIADNTFCIMASHLLFINIPNFFVYFRKLGGSERYPDFDMELFRNSPWVRYSPNTRLAGFFCGLICSLLLAWLLEILKRKFTEIMKRSQQKAEMR